MRYPFRKIVITALTIVFACMGTVAHAEESDDSAIEQKKYGGISYVSGGVGMEERNALAAVSKDYSLKLVFASKGGAYLADITVQISDSTGKKIFNAVADGPWFLVNLPPGKYTVTATMMGKAKQNRITLGNGPRQATLHFFWT